MEALYQSLTGAGYDQNCDGVYDSTTDILPFLSSASDRIIILAKDTLQLLGELEQEAASS